MSKKAEVALTHLDALRQHCRLYEFFSHHNIQKALRSIRQTCSDEQKKKFMDLFALAETESDADEADNDGNAADNDQFNQKVASSTGRKSAASNKSKHANPRLKRVLANDEEDSLDSSDSDNSDDEDTKPLSSSRAGANKHRNNKSSIGKSSISRKRSQPKNSYKGAESSDNTSEDESMAKKKKRRKKTAHSDSD